MADSLAGTCSVRLELPICAPGREDAAHTFGDRDIEKGCRIDIAFYALRPVLPIYRPVSTWNFWPRYLRRGDKTIQTLNGVVEFSETAARPGRGSCKRGASSSRQHLMPPFIFHIHTLMDDGKYYRLR